MEDALAHLKAVYLNITYSLNPCCNGRCTRTTHYRRSCSSCFVLILVVMEDALARNARNA